MKKKVNVLKIFMNFYNKSIITLHEKSKKSLPRARARQAMFKICVQGAVRQTLTGPEKSKTEIFFIQNIMLSNQRVIHFLVSYDFLCFVDVFDD